MIWDRLKMVQYCTFSTSSAAKYRAVWAHDIPECLYHSSCFVIADRFKNCFRVFRISCFTHSIEQITGDIYITFKTVEWFDGRGEVSFTLFLFGAEKLSLKTFSG